MKNAHTLQNLAAAWRERSGADNPHHATAGVVLIYRGQVYGWKDALRDPGHERPGVYAVNVDNMVFRAVGGDAYNGAERWEQIA